jgi:predicted nucleic acid-binding protein
LPGHPRIVLSIVVIHELLIGAMTPARERSLRRGLIDLFKMRRRIHTPAQRTWELAAKVDRRLRQTKSFKSSLLQRSFFNDILIAVSARDLGATILTENEKNFWEGAHLPEIYSSSSPGSLGPEEWTLSGPNFG